MKTTNLVKRGVETLGVCERSLQELIGCAAAASDYGAIMELTSMAKAVADIASSVTGDGSAAAPPPAGLPAAAEPGRAVARKKAGNYPKFIRRGDDLIKIGWSKKEKKVYQHKAHRGVIDVVVAALVKVGQGNKIFITDKLMAAIEPSDGNPVPEYQVYVALAWLKHTGLIDQHGRQGYSISSPLRLVSDVEVYWQRIQLKAETQP
jgi:hypothetical protein